MDQLLIFVSKPVACNIMVMHRPLSTKNEGV